MEQRKMDLDGGHHNPIFDAFLIFFSTTNPNRLATDPTIKIIQPLLEPKGMWRCNNFSTYARDTQVSTLKKVFFFFLFEQSGLGNGMVGTGVHGKRKAQVRHGRQGGATFPSSRHCIISCFFFFFQLFNFAHQSTAPNSNQINSNNTKTTSTTTHKHDTDGRKREYFFHRDSYGKGRDGGELGGNLTTFFPHWGAIRMEISQTWAQHAGKFLVLLVRMKLDMTGLIVLFRLIFGFCFFFNIEVAVLFFWSTLVFLFSHWFIFTKSACF